MRWKRARAGSSLVMRDEPARVALGDTPRERPKMAWSRLLGGLRCGVLGRSSLDCDRTGRHDRVRAVDDAGEALAEVAELLDPVGTVSAEVLRGLLQGSRRLDLRDLVAELDGALDGLEEAVLGALGGA